MSDVVRSTLTIVNLEGLHARPSGTLVAIAQGYQSEFTIEYEDHQVNGRSILELISLGAKCGAELHLTARGEDAQELLEHLARVIESGFDELA